MIESTSVLLKYSFIYLISVISFRRFLPSLKAQITRGQVCLLLLCGLCLCTTMVFLRELLRPVSILAMVAVSITVNRIVFQKEISLTITATIISYAVSYLTYFFAVLVSALFAFYHGHLYGLWDIVDTVAIGAAQLFFTYLLFRIKRLRHGLPFLDDSKYGDLGVYLSVSVLIAVSFLGLEEHATIVAPVLICVLIICCIALYYWWRNRTTEEYLNQLKEREQQELNNEIDFLKERIALLEKDNEALSKIVHKDNKLIPALDLSVKQFLLSVAMNNVPYHEPRITENFICGFNIAF